MSIRTLRLTFVLAAACAPAFAEPPAKTQVPPTGKAGIQWVKIPGGTFQMGNGAGDAAPVHAVTVKTFQIAQTLVTNKQYKACVKAKACAPADDCGTKFAGDDQPVVCVDWKQAAAFSAWAGGRLPTEAEWEYAARSGGKDRKYPWGDAEATCDTADISGCGNAPLPVCSKAKGNTDQGLCDMAGNVWEWLQDWHHPSYKGAPTDGSAWDDEGQNRVKRGGSWFSVPADVTTANRNSYSPSTRDVLVGFRPAR
jgi:sulfatase modifying factor 1